MAIPSTPRIPSPALDPRVDAPGGRWVTAAHDLVELGKPRITLLVLFTMTAMVLRWT